MKNQKGIVSPADLSARPVMLQISAGQGPRECAWVVAQVLARLTEQAESLSIKVEVVQALAFDKALRKQDKLEPDSYRSVLLQLIGPKAESMALSWLGTICWKNESVYREKHQRKNWYISVEQISVSANEASGVEVIARDVSFAFIQSRGPGGQHVNKTSSAVRAKHRPSGLQVRVDSARSQHQNKAIALQRLALLLSLEAEGLHKVQAKENWKKHYQVHRGNPVRTFYGADFSEFR